jgi:hypothetical protein
VAVVVGVVVVVLMFREFWTYRGPVAGSSTTAE